MGRILDDIVGIILVAIIIASVFVGVIVLVGMFSTPNEFHGRKCAQSHATRDLRGNEVWVCDVWEATK